MNPTNTMQNEANIRALPKFSLLTISILEMNLIAQKEKTLKIKWFP